MNIRHHTLVEGNSLSFKGGFFGFSAIVLIEADGQAPVLFDCGHHSTRLLLTDALQARGLKPADIGTVFLSHLHFDHANNIDLFPDARFMLGASEMQYAQAPAEDDPFCSIGTNHYLSTRNVERLDNEEGEVFPGLYYRHAPGHTPGSYLLHFTNPQGERVVLAGDACKTYRELVTRESGHIFDPQNRAEQTLQWIATHADVIVPGHHPELRRSDNGWIWDEPSRLELIVR
ncbi:MBL fold metallo-hydrolase [Orrella sp. 11846]|uniref:MBL fold metallo-hydrolase n=1 Tax=Orrella sp. 11846 TaxID=3409913 RepID=UPI003B5AE94E